MNARIDMCRPSEFGVIRDVLLHARNDPRLACQEFGPSQTHVIRAQWRRLDCCMDFRAS